MQHPDGQVKVLTTLNTEQALHNPLEFFIIYDRQVEAPRVMRPLICPQRKLLILQRGHAHPGKTEDHHASVKVFSRQVFFAPQNWLKGCPGWVACPSIMLPG